MITPLELPSTETLSSFDAAKHYIKLYLFGFLFHDEVSKELLQIGLPPAEMQAYEKYVIDLANSKQSMFSDSKNEMFGKSINFFFTDYEDLLPYDLPIFRKKETPDNTSLHAKYPKEVGSQKFIFDGNWMEELGFVHLDGYWFSRTVQPFMITSSQVLRNVFVVLPYEKNQSYETLKHNANIHPSMFSMSGFGEFLVYTLTDSFRKRYNINQLIPESEPAFGAILYGRKESTDPNEIGMPIGNLEINKEVFVVGDSKVSKSQRQVRDK